MNPRMQNVLIVVLAVFLILVGAFAYMQNVTLQQQAASIRSINQQLSSLQQQAQPTPTPSPAPAPAPSPVPTTTVAIATASRVAFGSQISPDGVWRLEIQDQGDPQSDLQVVHSVILRNLQGGTDKTLLTATEYRQTSYEPVAGKPFSSNWMVAGWSADGKTVYYVRNTVKEGLGGFYPSFVGSAMELYGVTVADGQVRLVFDSKASGVIDGIRDVLAIKNLLVISQPTTDGNKSSVIVSDLDGKNRRSPTYVTKEQGEGIAAAVFSADGSHLMIVVDSFVNVGQQDSYYAYKLVNEDISSGKTEEVALNQYQVNGGYPQYFEDPRWDSASTFSFKVSDTERKTINL